MAQTWRIIVGVACACVCNGARADVVKLADLELRALARKPEIEASAARVRQASAGIEAAKTGYRPTIAASIDASLAPGRTLISITDDENNRYLVSGTRSLDQSSAFNPAPRYGGSVSARGNFYDFGRTRAALDAARAKQRATQADSRARAEVVVLEVRAAYLRWSVAYALYDLAKQAEAGAQARVDRVSGLIAEGAAPPSAATSANAATNLAASEAERAALELDTARYELGYLSARDLGADAVPDPGLLAGPVAPAAGKPQPSAAAAGGGGSNARIEALATARAAADAESEAQSRLSTPALGYRLNAGIEGQNEKLFPVYAVGVGLTVPLWDGGATSAAEAGARAVAAELAAQLDAERARDTHLRARQTMQAAHVQRLIALAEAAVTLAETRITQLEVGPTLASAEQAALAEAEAERSRARADLIRARATRAQLALGLP